MCESASGRVVNVSATRVHRLELHRLLASGDNGGGGSMTQYCLEQKCWPDRLDRRSVEEERAANDAFRPLGSSIDDCIAGPCRLRRDAGMPSGQHRGAWSRHRRRDCCDCGRTGRSGCRDWWRDRSNRRCSYSAAGGLSWPFANLLLRNPGAVIDFTVSTPRPRLGATLTVKRPGGATDGHLGPAEFQAAGCRECR
jgi:hypothetical protein